MSRHEIVLHGCTPEPLMNYLKALGVFRIIAEQKDLGARGFWRDGEFVLSSSLKGDDLIEFFLDEKGYMPSSILSPWNGDGGFLTDSGKSYYFIEQLRSTENAKLEKIKNAVLQIEKVRVLDEFRKAREKKKELDNKKIELKKQKKKLSEPESKALKEVIEKIKKIKETIIFEVRNCLPDPLVQWVDTCMAARADGFAFSPLMGTGGLDGRMEFSVNYLSNVSCFLNNDSADRDKWVIQALFGHGEGKLIETAIGQFSPGSIGGPNATQGFEGNSAINPLDYILMIEGTLLMCGAATRKYGFNRTTKGSFPFTVYSSASGNSSLCNDEVRSARGELWLPLWPMPASLSEIRHIFAEGRADIAGKQVATGNEFARAVASLGIDRGIQSFSRYGFLLRNGKAFLATPLGRFDVHARRDVDLLREIDRWLDSFRIPASDDKAPPRFKIASKKIEASIFDFCHYGGAARFSKILCSLGCAERELANGDKFRKDKNLRPISSLSPEWIKAANDGSAEFDIALALAGVFDGDRKIGPLRANLEPVTWHGHTDWKGFVAWSDTGGHVVWNSASLSNNLTCVLERRLTDGDRNSCSQLPIMFKRTVVLDSISAFLAGDVDDRKIEKLLWGLMLIDHAKEYPDFISRSQKDNPPPIPREFALLRLLFLPAGIKMDGDRIKIPPEKGIFALLRGGRVDEACIIAQRRLRASGIVTMPHRSSSGPNRDAEWHDCAKSIDPLRLAASLLIPLAEKDINHLCNMIIRPVKN